MLLAEDDEFGKEIMLHILKNFGYKTASASDGKEVIVSIESDNYNLVLMDVDMPEIDGIEATRILRDKGFVIPIIAMTSCVMQGDKERCIEAGMNDYISKPINNELLYKTIKKHLNKKR